MSFHSRIQSERRSPSAILIAERRTKGLSWNLQSDIRILIGHVCTQPIEPKPVTWPKIDHWVDGWWWGVLGQGYSSCTAHQMATKWKCIIIFQGRKGVIVSHTPNWSTFFHTAASMIQLKQKSDLSLLYSKPSNSCRSQRENKSSSWAHRPYMVWLPFPIQLPLWSLSPSKFFFSCTSLLPHSLRAVVHTKPSAWSTLHPYRLWLSSSLPLFKMAFWISFKWQLKSR